MTETHNYLKTDCKIYGGEIELEDFDTTNNPNKRRINNQANANKLQQTLESQKIKLEEEKKYKKMSLEELRNEGLISKTDGLPGDNLTDEKWQKEFEIRKLYLTLYDEHIKEYSNNDSKETGTWDEETQGIYCGATCEQNYYYCSGTNDILENIRAGQIDYCYRIHQIMDLAKSHIDTIRTKYFANDGYWEVWLEELEEEK